MAARRSFTAEQKRSIVLECERPGITVSAVARTRRLATSVLFPWRAELGYGREEDMKLALLKLAGCAPDARSQPLVLKDLMPIPDGDDRN
jgi:transposase-like protein